MCHAVAQEHTIQYETAMLCFCYIRSMRTEIESFAIELWFDVFAYLKASDVFRAFFNLNKRLDQIVIASRTAISCKDNGNDAQYLLKHVLPHLTHREYVTQLRLENTNKMDMVRLANLIEFPRLRTLTLHRMNIKGTFLSVLGRIGIYLRRLTITPQVSIARDQKQAFLRTILSLPNVEICRLHLRIIMCASTTLTATSTSMQVLHLIGAPDVCLVDRLMIVLQRLPRLQDLRIIASSMNFDRVHTTNGGTYGSSLSTITLDVKEFAFPLTQLTDLVCTVAPHLTELKLVSHTAFQNADYVDFRTWNTVIQSLPDFRTLDLNFTHIADVHEKVWKRCCQALRNLFAENKVDLQLPCGP